jgi:hypothetical protein
LFKERWEFTMPRLLIGNFSLDVSPDWKLATVVLIGPPNETPESSPMLSAEPQPPFRQNIVAAMEQVGAEETPDSYFNKVVNQLITAGINRQSATPPEKVTLLSGREGLITEQVAIAPTGAQVRQMQLISIKDDSACIVVATDLDGDSFERSRARFREILMSFE